MPVRFRQEVQAVLWRGDGELNGCGSAYDGRRPHLPPNRQGFFLGDFPTVSYQNCWLAGVRLDLTEPRKGSSYAKHCILLIAFTVEIGSEKIPLPAPAQKSSKYAAGKPSSLHTTTFCGRRRGLFVLSFTVVVISQ